jgi:hypothetical protein
VVRFTVRPLYLLQWPLYWRICKPQFTSNKLTIGNFPKKLSVIRSFKKFLPFNEPDCSIAVFTRARAALSHMSPVHRRIQCSSVSSFSLLSLFGKYKKRLMRSTCCLGIRLCVCVSPLIFVVRLMRSHCCLCPPTPSLLGNGQSVCLCVPP